jgi:Na+/proline symporter
MKNLKFIICGVFYTIGALMLAFALWAFSHSRDVVAEAIEFGQISYSDNLYEIISFHMNSAGQYFAFAILLIGIGVATHISLMLYSKRNENASPVGVEDIIKELSKTKKDKELDDWFDEVMDDESEEAR